MVSVDSIGDAVCLSGEDLKNKPVMVQPSQGEKNKAELEKEVMKDIEENDLEH